MRPASVWLSDCAGTTMNLGASKLSQQNDQPNILRNTR
jgi:hypothetical protein